MTELQPETEWSATLLAKPAITYMLDSHIVGCDPMQGRHVKVRRPVGVFQFRFGAGGKRRDLLPLKAVFLSSPCSGPAKASAG